MPKYDENNAGKIKGVRVNNTTTSVQKKLRKKLFGNFPNYSFIELFIGGN